MKKLYGSLNNRFEEGKTVPEIKVDMPITMYYWSDRTCYYVTEVKDQKHIKVKKYIVLPDYTKGYMSNQWMYFKTIKAANKYLKASNKPIYTTDPIREEEWVYRYNHWYLTHTDDNNKKYYTKLSPISFDILNYYYDYEF